jgi:arabinogalactan endo-1,4-beta-galactosidase
MKSAGVDYDVIGLSYYPYFHGQMSVLDNALTLLESNNYVKEIQVVEAGYPSKWAVKGTTYDYTSVYPYSHEGQRKFTADLITMLQKHTQVNGLSWWYAEANAKGTTGNLSTDWYNASLFDNETGRALPALYELKVYGDGDTGIRNITATRPTADIWYTLDGRRLNGTPATRGLYINNGRKVVRW